MAGSSRTAPEGRGGSISRDGHPDPATEAFVAVCSPFGVHGGDLRCG